MWNADSKLSSILSSSIQIFIFSGDSMPVGIGNEILSLLPLIFCFKLSPALQEKKKTHNCCHLSFHWLLSVEKKEDMVWTDSGAKLQVKFGFRSRFLRVFLLSPPRSQQPPSLTIPESSQCSVLTRQPLPGPPSSLSPSFHQNMLSLLFFILFLK